jgi:hypothetical protein
LITSPSVYLDKKSSAAASYIACNRSGYNEHES